MSDPLVIQTIEIDEARMTLLRPRGGPWHEVKARMRMYADIRRAVRRQIKYVPQYRSLEEAPVPQAYRDWAQEVMRAAGLTIEAAND